MGVAEQYRCELTLPSFGVKRALYRDLLHLNCTVTTIHTYIHMYICISQLKIIENLTLNHTTIAGRYYTSLTSEAEEAEEEEGIYRRGKKN